jgi:hypothetical protein
MWLALLFFSSVLFGLDGINATVDCLTSQANEVPELSKFNLISTDEGKFRINVCFLHSSLSSEIYAIKAPANSNNSVIHTTVTATVSSPNTRDEFLSSARFRGNENNSSVN